jgi:hypothetical protein
LAFFGLTFVLHLGIALLLNVWPHSFVIVVVNVILLPRGLWGQRAASVEPPDADARRWPRWGREAAAVALMFAASVQVARDNQVIASRLSLPTLPLLEPLVGYARLYQDWSMFRRVPTRDGTLVIDAVTADGRRIDPLRGAAPDFDAPLHGPWGYSQIECDYHFQIQRPSRAVYLEGLANYLRSWHRLEGRGANDELRSFEVYWVGSEAPAPGSSTPTPLDRRLLLLGP